MNRLADHNLSETRNRLLKEIASFNDENFNKKLAPDQWSPAQICHHLVLVEKAFANVIAYGVKKDKPIAEPKDLSFFKDRTKKINAPEMVLPTEEPLEVQQIKEMLQASRSEFLAVLERIEDRSILAKKSAKHPIYGDMPLDQWVEMLFLHEDRHIEQMRAIK